MNIKPLSDRVVLQAVAAEETTRSGIILAGNAQEKSQMAEVVAVGPGTDDNPMTVKVGDRVIFKQYAGTNVTLDKEEYTVLSVGDILATVE
ncbi:MAG: co-chaperone GroES [Oscillospiraceae bacterium]|nr:co-chaperone GroES [Oscillospiraceae bacterium]